MADLPTDTNPANDTPAAPALTLSPADIAALLDKLGLDPATADVAALLAKLDELTGTATTAQTAAADAAAQMTELRAQLDSANAVITDYQAREAAALDAELNESLDGYELSEAQRAAIFAILKNDRAQGDAVLSALPKKTAPAPAENPPPPQHDPLAQAQEGEAQTADQKAAEADKLIRSIQAAGKFPDYTAAREEARRQKAALFS